MNMVEIDASVAISAAKISDELKIPMADSLMLATARAYKATFWTQDADFSSIKGVMYRAKAD